LYAAFFTAYAITRFIFAILGGIWVDRFTAKTVFKFFLIPIPLGIIPFALMESITGALIFDSEWIFQWCGSKGKSGSSG